MIKRIIHALTPEYIKSVRAERHAWAILHTIERERRQQTTRNGRRAA